MNTVEKINENLEFLPSDFRAEVLNFTEFLIFKTRQKPFRKDNNEWSSLSLQSAMRDMEDEDTSEYNLSDLKEKFS